jgi:8-oxo-dGTP diphosphatase
MSQAPNAASVALIDRSRVLLIQRANPPYHGLWTLPGGRLEAGETPEAAAARELKEELGLAVFALRQVTRLSLGGTRGFRLQVFATEAFEGEIVPSPEIVAYRWVDAGRMAGMAVTPHLPDVIERAFRLFDRT